MNSILFRLLDSYALTVNDYSLKTPEVTAGYCCSNTCHLKLGL
ncbi:hypothetical protein [Campylobacter pinnipediorum]|nr:hypothetical protein [Campylobacter pinnipediorum]